MLSQSSDPTSLILLFLGKEHPWIPIIGVLFITIQNWSKIIGWYEDLTLFKKAQYKVSGIFHNNIYDNNIYGRIDTSVWALIRYINNIVKNDKKLLSRAVGLRFPNNAVFSDYELIVIPASGSIIELNKDIKCKIQILYQTRDAPRQEKSIPIDSTTITFTLITSKSFDLLRLFMSDIIENHLNIIKNERESDIHIIKPKLDKNEELTVFPTLIKFTSSKIFDNLYFDGKEELIQRLDAFINREKYSLLGLPETLGLLFYGEPGTGKTSCIKAIANYLKMNLILVPMNHIKTKKQLEDLFFGDVIDVPQNKRIYVFEEIDCNGWENIICERTKRTKTEKMESLNTEQKLLEQITTNLCGDMNKKDKDKNESDKLTLGAILEIIDGLVECPGRIIIMTTNHKENIDPALLRPGRIDMEIEFRKLRHTHIAEIYKKWYNKNIQLNDIRKITDYKYSQAEISQLLFKYKNSPADFLEEISKIK